jgi:hypothetical protein
MVWGSFISLTLHSCNIVTRKDKFWERGAGSCCTTVWELGVGKTLGLCHLVLVGVNSWQSLFEATQDFPGNRSQFPSPVVCTDLDGAIDT